LQRFEGSEEDGLAACQATDFEEGVEGCQRPLANAPVGNQIGIIPPVAVERRECPLEERHSDRWPHVHARVEQLCSQRCAPLGDAIEARARPIEATIDCGRFAPRQLPHRSGISVRTGHRFGDAEAGRPASVRRMTDVSAFPLNQGIDQIVDLQFLLHRRLLVPSRTCVTK
jgi:hypothetical protein